MGGSRIPLSCVQVNFLKPTVFNTFTFEEQETFFYLTFSKNCVYLATQ